MRYIRWSIVVSKETDLALRTYLANMDGKKSDISKFVDEAVWTRHF